MTTLPLGVTLLLEDVEVVVKLAEYLRDRPGARFTLTEYEAGRLAAVRQEIAAVKAAGGLNGTPRT